MKRFCKYCQEVTEFEDSICQECILLMSESESEEKEATTSDEEFINDETE